MQYRSAQESCKERNCRINFQTIKGGKIIKIILLLSAFINISFSYTFNSGEPLLKNESKFYSINSSMESERISLSIGSGASIYKPAFIISSNVGLRLSKNINLMTGFDIFTNSTNVSRTFCYNLIPYYILTPSKNTKLQIGVGGSFFRARVSPIFSARFDFSITKRNFVGGEIKSFLIATTVDEFPFPILMVNYTVVL